MSSVTSPSSPANAWNNVPKTENPIGVIVFPLGSENYFYCHLKQPYPIYNRIAVRSSDCFSQAAHRHGYLHSKSTYATLIINVRATIAHQMNLVTETKDVAWDVMLYWHASTAWARMIGHFNMHTSVPEVHWFGRGSWKYQAVLMVATLIESLRFTTGV